MTDHDARDGQAGGASELPSKSLRPAVLAIAAAALIGIFGRVLVSFDANWADLTNDVLGLFAVTLGGGAFLFIARRYCNDRLTQTAFLFAFIFLVFTGLAYLIVHIPGSQNVPLIGENTSTRDTILPVADYLSVIFIIVGFVSLARELIHARDEIAQRSAQQEATKEALRKSEAKYRDLVEDAGELIHRLAPDGTIEYVSPAAKRLMGYTSQDLIGKSCFEFLPADAAETIRDGLQAYVSSKSRDPIRFDYRAYHKDGRTRWLQQTTRLVFDGDEPVSLVSIAQDVTDRKEAEEKLHQTQVRLNQLIQQVPAVLWTTDRDLIVTSRAGMGLGPLDDVVESALGRRVEDLLAILGHENPGRVLDLHRRALAGERFSYDSQMGDYTFHNIIEPLRGPDESIIGVLGLSVDATERVRMTAERQQLESRMQHTQKLESLGVLAGGIAHDFNNLLMGVLGNASLIMMDLDEDSTLRAPLQDIERAARRAAELCGQMLAYSGRGPFVLMSIDVNEVMSDVLRLVNASSPKQIGIELDLDEHLPLIEGDSSQIHQVCMNLVINAVEAVGDNPGTVRISTAARELTDGDLQSFYYPVETIETNRFVVITVQDDGCGMSRDVIDRVFEPFYTTKFTGRGLGMAVVSGIVRSHHGAIRIESEIDEGTTFTIALPAAAKPVSEPPPVSPADSATWTASARALVIDDEEAVCRVAEKSLARCGLIVSVAFDGEEGMEVYRAADSIDIVVLDMTMPKMNGAEVYKALRAIDPNLPIIISSGYSGSEAMAQVDVNGGPTEFLQKPYRPQELISCVRSLLDSARS